MDDHDHDPDPDCASQRAEPEAHDVVWWRRWRPIVVTALVVGWIGIQVAVPAVRALERGGGVRPRTAGWQMFSHTIEGSAETFTIETRNGRRPVDIAPLLTGPMRKEVLYAPAIVAELCARPEIFAVEVSDVEWGTARVSCR